MAWGLGFSAPRASSFSNRGQFVLHCTASQNISPKSDTRDRQTPQAIGCSESNLPGNLLPRTSQLTSGEYPGKKKKEEEDYPG